MRRVICDKCGIEAALRNPQVEGWSERLIKNNENYYLDFCSKCSKEFDNVKAAAQNTYDATITAWLNGVIATNNQGENV